MLSHDLKHASQAKDKLLGGRNEAWPDGQSQFAVSSIGAPFVITSVCS
jgi:hypothetical protein